VLSPTKRLPGPACANPFFDPRPDAPDAIVSRSPETPFGVRRVVAQNAASIPASCRSRKLGTAFRSPVTTLSHHYEVNAPALLLRFHADVSSRTRSTESSSARFGFEADTGRTHYLRPVVRADLRRSRDAIRSPLPFGLFPTCRIKAFNRLHHNKLAQPDARLSFAPRGALFRFSPRINAQNPHILSTNVVKNPALRLAEFLNPSHCMRRRAITHPKMPHSLCLFPAAKIDAGPSTGEYAKQKQG